MFMTQSGGSLGGGLGTPSQSLQLHRPPVQPGAFIRKVDLERTVGPAPLDAYLLVWVAVLSGDPWRWAAECHALGTISRSHLAGLLLILCYLLASGVCVSIN